MKQHRHKDFIPTILHKFEYNQDGTLFWKEGHGSKKKFDRVGSVDRHGYLQVHIGEHNVFVHRIIWFMHHGTYPDQIDHINRDRTDNRIENLRAADNSSNQRNVGLRKDNSTGHKGIHIADGKYLARIRFKNVRHYLGVFKTLEEAVQAYRDKEVELYGKAS